MTTVKLVDVTAEGIDGATAVAVGITTSASNFAVPVAAEWLRDQASEALRLAHPGVSEIVVTHREYEMDVVNDLCIGPFGVHHPEHDYDGGGQCRRCGAEPEGDWNG